MGGDSGTPCCGPGYASPAEAIKAPREKLLYSIAIYTGTGIQKPDYLATVDADPDSPTYSQVIHRLEMTRIGDELHHMGWNACSSCHGDASMSRSYLLVPGVRSNSNEKGESIQILLGEQRPRRAPRNLGGFYVLDLARLGESVKIAELFA